MATDNTDVRTLDWTFIVKDERMKGGEGGGPPGPPRGPGRDITDPLRRVKALVQQEMYDIQFWQWAKDQAEAFRQDPDRVERDAEQSKWATDVEDSETSSPLVGKAERSSK